MIRHEEGVVGNDREAIEQEEQPLSTLDGLDMASLLETRTPAEAWEAIRGPEFRALDAELTRLRTEKRGKLLAYERELGQEYGDRIKHCRIECQRLGLERSSLEVNQYGQYVNGMKISKLVERMWHLREAEGVETDSDDDFVGAIAKKLLPLEVRRHPDDPEATTMMAELRQLALAKKVAPPEYRRYLDDSEATAIVAEIRQLADQNSDQIEAEAAENEKGALEAHRQSWEGIGDEHKPKSLTWARLRYARLLGDSADFWRFLANLGQNKKQPDHYTRQPMSANEELHELVNMKLGSLSKLVWDFEKFVEGYESSVRKD